MQQNANAKAPSSSLSLSPVALDTHDDAYFDNGTDLRAANANVTGRWIADATMRFRVLRRQVPFGHKVIVGAVVAASFAILGMAGVESFASSAPSSGSAVSDPRHVAGSTHARVDASKRTRTTRVVDPRHTKRAHSK